MGKTITARIYIGNEPISKVEYKTRNDSRYGNRLARLTLDEFVGFTKGIAEDNAESWTVTYTDGEEELAFVSTDNPDKIDIEINGELVETIIQYSGRGREEVMWGWLKAIGWY